MMKRNNKISHWMTKASKLLENAGIPESKIESELVLAYLLEISRGELSVMSINNDTILQNIFEQADEIIRKRCSTRKPLAYLLGQWEFYGILLDIDENVLIPRPETEILVDLILKKFPDKPLLGIDIGTGSCAIAIALLKNRKNWRIIGADISGKALRIARKNAERYGLLDRFFPVECDICAPFDRCDFIVANLPYVSTGQLDEIQPEVRYEPRKALDGGSNGLMFIRNLLKASAKIETNFLAIEFGIGQEIEIAKIIEQNNYKYEIIEDYAKIPRFASIEKRAE